MTPTKGGQWAGHILDVGVLACLFVYTPQALGQFSGFLEEYPELQPMENMPGPVWKAPAIDKKYRAVLFDALGDFLDPESEYKSIQPDALPTDPADRVGFSEYITGGRVVFEDVIKFYNDQANQMFLTTTSRRNRLDPRRHT